MLSEDHGKADSRELHMMHSQNDDIYTLIYILIYTLAHLYTCGKQDLLQIMKQIQSPCNKIRAHFRTFIGIMFCFLV